MKVLLLQTRRCAGLGFSRFIATEPLGLEVVAASLDRHEVRILDLFHDRELVTEIDNFKPQAVGISCSFTTDVYKAIFLAQIVKSLDPQIFTFIGGHHASLVPEDFPRPLVDAVVIGDGEATAPHLIDALEGDEDLTGVPGLAMNTPDGQVLTAERPLALNLDGLPIPARSLTKRYRKRYYLGTRQPIVTMETSRGCPHRCNFCSIWRFHRGKVRSMTPERVVEEIKTLGPGDVLFADDNFLADAERAYKIADMIERSELRRRYIFQARSDTIIRHPDVIEKWAFAGLDGVFIGFEKTDQEGLNSVDKGNTTQNNEKALKLLQSLNIDVYASFIVDPMFTEREFDMLLQYIQRFKIRDPYFTVLTPLPGTKLYEQAARHIMTKNYALYDLLHAVLPTKLPLERFYQEFTRLYRESYFKGQEKWSLMKTLMAKVVSGKISVSHILRLLDGLRLAVDYRAYLSPALSDQFKALGKPAKH